MAGADDDSQRAPTTIALTGEIDAANADVIERAARIAIRGGTRELALDLSKVTFMDSQGLKALLGARERLREVGGVLVLREPAPCVRKLLTIAGLDGVFDVC